MDLDYEEILAELERERQRLEEVIAYFRHKAGLQGELSPADPSRESGNGSPADKKMREDTFFGMGTPDAIQKYLAMKKRPQTPKEIEEALLKGGLITSAKSFYNTLYTSLRRLLSQGVLVNMDGKWALAEWYPSVPKQTRKGKSDKPKNGDKEKSKN